MPDAVRFEALGSRSTGTRGLWFGRLLLVAGRQVVRNVDHVGPGVLVEAVLSVGAPDARLSPARVESLHRLEVLAVDVRLAELDLLAGAHGDVEVRGVDRRREAIDGVVRVGDRLVEVVEGDDRHDGPEDLVPNDWHTLPAVAEHCRWVEIALRLVGGPLASGENRGPVGNGLLDPLFDQLELI